MLYYILIYSLYIEYISQYDSDYTGIEQIILKSPYAFSYRREDEDEFTIGTEYILNSNTYNTHILNSNTYNTHNNLTIKEYLRDNYEYINNFCFYIIIHSITSNNCILKHNNKSLKCITNTDVNSCISVCIKIELYIKQVFIQQSTIENATESAENLLRAGLYCKIFKVEDAYVNIENKEEPKDMRGIYGLLLEEAEE
ncbi:hypothetical protein EHP00_2308 [Ecytonucleospora hepatopenaei]|uniref:Uncharacterized protein n=1 Tax=Ecytonucleospora hepatopenaei TaxID=646526 RepID=A0A1W0E394_9MICR|nr:hypothetical protein EHP00_2308 [Ecytonucleospora hepatopenaei]